MNILGVGAWELIAILLIMLVFAGPKRMIHWSYVLGQHVAKFRKIWSQTVDLVQKEFDDAGVNIKLPKEPPTRKNLNSAITEAVKPMSQPLQDSLEEVKKDIDSVKEVSDTLNEKKKTTTPAPANSKPEPKPETLKQAEKPKLPTPSPAAIPASAPEPENMGTWSGSGPSTDNANGNSADLGSWSRTTGDD